MQGMGGSYRPLENEVIMSSVWSMDKRCMRWARICKVSDVLRGGSPGPGRTGGSSTTRPLYSNSLEVITCCNNGKFMSLTSGNRS